MKKVLLIVMLPAWLALLAQQGAQTGSATQQSGASSQTQTMPAGQQAGQMQQPPATPPQPAQPAAAQNMAQPAVQPAASACPAAEAVPGPPSGPAPPASKPPEIKDQAEYNAYVAAVQASTPQAKASGLEGFLTTYPNSVAKADALNALMTAYQQTGNADKLQQTAQRAVDADPNNAIAWVYLAALLRNRIESGQVPANQVPEMATQLAQFAQKGLDALPRQPKPSDQMSDAQFQQLRDQLWQEFVRGLGFAALQNKDYCKAQQFISAIARQNPNDFAAAYQLATAYLEQTPPNPVGFWWGAKAVSLAPAQNKDAIQKYATYKYTKFHGDNEGWDQVMASAASSPAPPAGFTVAPAPTPPEQAAKMVASKPIDQMSLDEIQFILTSGNQQAADQVWNGIKDKPIAAEGKYVGPGDNPDSVQLAGLYDDITATPAKADIAMTLAIKPGPKQMPKPGDTVDFQGNPVSFTPNPFMITMEKGCLIDMKTRKCMTPAPEKPAPRRPGTTTRRPGTRPPGQ
ncbi:MAG: hypothetical protein JO041_09090 [Acidobacteria bacterium]|nr:hypothetical protein [Acidobacteriota bacterium]